MYNVVKMNIQIHLLAARRMINPKDLVSKEDRVDTSSVEETLHGIVGHVRPTQPAYYATNVFGIVIMKDMRSSFIELHQAGVVIVVI